MAWDSSFKNILKRLMGNTGIEVITETDIATSNQRIDFVIPNNDRSSNLFTHARKLIIGEFKSENEKLYSGDLLMLLSKAYNYIAHTHGYAGKKSTLDPIELSDVSCVLFLGGKKSIKSFSTLKLNIKKIDEGIYEVQGPRLHTVVMEIDNIILTNEFQALKIFAKKNIREKTLKEAILYDNRFIKSIAYFLYKEEITTMAKAEGKPLSPMSLSIRSAVETIGLLKVIEEVGFSRVIEEVGFSKVIEEVGLSRVIEEVGINELNKHLTDEQFNELVKLRKKR